MPLFARSFPSSDTLSKWDMDNPGNAVRSLFERWALPGEAVTSAKPLRLGLRDGYVNFYVKGQSVAKLSCGPAGPRVSVHEAYVAGRPRSAERGDPQTQSYVTFAAETLSTPATSSLVQRWIDTAATYASAEKRFVDDLVAANPGVIDLEMGLPAADLPGSLRVAPRMDLVVVQMLNGIPSIAFWEAKCANNPELRSSSEFELLEESSFVGPKVINQINKYVAWMAQNGRVTEVQAAYQATAGVLLAFHKRFRVERESACLPIWQTLADTSLPCVIVKPGVVIGNYWPKGSTEGIASERMRQAADRFARKHRGEIEKNGIHVHEVGPSWEGPTLPQLTGDGVLV